jgi:hypothetical protein
MSDGWRPKDKILTRGIAPGVKKCGPNKTSLKLHSLRQGNASVESLNLWDALLRVEDSSTYRRAGRLPRISMSSGFSLLTDIRRKETMESEEELTHVGIV